MAQYLFPHNMGRTRACGNQQLQNVDYDVKPAKISFTSHEDLPVHPLILSVSSQLEYTIVSHFFYMNKHRLLLFIFSVVTLYQT